VVPDLRITVQDIIAAGDRPAVRSTVTGTPAGPYLAVDPAGRAMRFEAIGIWRIEDGLVAEGWHVEDFVSALVDWGAVTFASRPRDVAPPRAADAAMDAPADPMSVVRGKDEHSDPLLLVSSARSSVTTSSATARSVTRSPGFRAPAASDETGVGHEVAVLQQVITRAMLNQLRGALRGCAGYGT